MIETIYTDDREEKLEQGFTERITFTAESYLKDGRITTVGFDSTTYLPELLDEFKRFLLGMGYTEGLVNQYLCDYGNGVCEFPQIDDTPKMERK